MKCGSNRTVPHESRREIEFTYREIFKPFHLKTIGGKLVGEILQFNPLCFRIKSRMKFLPTEITSGYFTPPRAIAFRHFAVDRLAVRRQTYLGHWLLLTFSACLSSRITWTAGLPPRFKSSPKRASPR